MIKASSPCPVCNKLPKIANFENGWFAACIGDRHCVEIFRCKKPEEAVAAWEKFFGPKADAPQVGS